MGVVSIIGAALVVGVIVYALSLRSSDEPLVLFRRRSAGPTGEGLGFGDLPAPPEPAPGSLLYVPVLGSTQPHWQTRVGGIVGLMLLVTAAALAVAIAIYQLGLVLNTTIQGFLGN
jgi:hypothetical protein